MVGYFRQAVERDPVNLSMYRYLGKALYYAGQYDAAETALRGAVELDPGFPALPYALGRVLLARGRRDDALAAFQAERSPTWGPFGLPLGYQALGRTADAKTALAAMVANPAGSEFQVAETYAYLGDSEQAFHWRDLAHQRRDPGLIWVRRDPLLRVLERDPRFAAFLARLKLPPP